MFHPRALSAVVLDGAAYLIAVLQNLIENLIFSREASSRQDGVACARQDSPGGTPSAVLAPRCDP